ncbi:phosphoserine phosphatase SerB (plasmid) [Haloferax mediterranei ATCC 33500]|nr:phosphoserine phosphatase SerB [Haloferax mediterranei]AHZ24332.1 phosphoserine phosphatase [Haloferax mediterranei ATCC 33500]MDX5990188.1 phosphoserine phosphatase SerB [Haloferax mediterranei ATCC 33500]QCQ76739.1 phosphoserine phosphatase SerB [Haloferax mediterranei ATCC 33500]
MALVAFDFDGTLCQSDMTVLLGREYDVAGEIRGLAEQGIRGDVDFTTSLRQRVSLLEGMPESKVDAAFNRCKLRNGAAEMLSDLRQSGLSVAIITGSFERGVEAALQRAGVEVDHIIANNLVVKNGALTGAVEGPLLDRQKDHALEELALAEGLDLGQTIAVGNGSQDLPMLRIAGTAIGFAPEPVVEEYCDVVMTSIRELQLYFEQHNLIKRE